MSTNLTEMNTEYLTRKHFKESLNISYDSGTNKRFFGTRKPDGNLFNKIKETMINEINKIKCSITKFGILSSDDLEYINDLNNRIKKINSLDGLELFTVYGISLNSLHKVRLMDYFEIVKNKPMTLYKAKGGEYPIYGATNTPDPEKYNDTYTIDTNGEDYLTLNKDGSVGYCFVRNGKFSQNGHVIVLRLKEEYKGMLDLLINSKLITLQVINMEYGFNKPINTDELNNIQLYLSFIEDNE